MPKQVILLIVNALVGSLLSSGCGRESEEIPETKPLVAVKVARAELRDVSLSVRAPAVIHPRAQAQIAARITAPIRSLSVRKGDPVVSGQVLAVLESSDLLAQRADAEAALRQAQQLYARREQLFQQGAIPERDFLVSKTDLEKAKAHADLVEAQLAFTELRSPFAGVVTEQFLYPGDMAKPEAPLFTIMDLAVVVARAQVPEAEASGVRVGERGAFEPTDTTGSSLEGRVTVVNRAVDLERRTIEVWCEIRNASGRLRSGAFGTLRIFTGTIPKSVVIPLAAVEFEGATRKGSVLVVDEKRIAHRREVEAGEVLDEAVWIKTGLSAGETVIVEGGYGLPDGTEVRFTENETP